MAEGQGENRESYDGLETTYPTRDGYKIMPRSLYITGKLVYGDATNIVRLIVVRVPQAPPSITITQLQDILYRGPTSAIPYVWAPYNRLNVPTAYKVIYDKRYILDNITKGQHKIKINLKKYLKPIDYTTNTSAS